jgi:hypothetical protein
MIEFWARSPKAAGLFVTSPRQYRHLAKASKELLKSLFPAKPNLAVLPPGFPLPSLAQANKVSQRTAIVYL